MAIVASAACLGSVPLAVLAVVASGASCALIFGFEAVLVHLRVGAIGADDGSTRASRAVVLRWAVLGVRRTVRIVTVRARWALKALTHALYWSVLAIGAGSALATLAVVALSARHTSHVVIRLSVDGAAEALVAEGAGAGDGLEADLTTVLILVAILAA